VVVEDFVTVIPGVLTIGMSSDACASAVWFECAVTLLCNSPLPAVGEPFASNSACVKLCVA
jgi:hypothetical protein